MPPEKDKILKVDGLAFKIPQVSITAKQKNNPNHSMTWIMALSCTTPLLITESHVLDFIKHYFEMQDTKTKIFLYLLKIA